MTTQDRRQLDRESRLAAAGARAAALIPRVVGGGKQLEGRLPRSVRRSQDARPVRAPGFLILAVMAAPIMMLTRDFSFWIVAAPIAVLALAGGAKHIAAQARREARVRELRAAHPAEPWRWDYQWDERGAHDRDTGRRARFGLTGAVVLGLVSAPFNIIGFRGLFEAIGARRLIALPFIGFGLAVAVGASRLLVEGLGALAQRLRYGRGLALFDTFPFRRGETLQLYVEAPPTLPQHALPTATLRCVQERYVTKSTKANSTRLHCFAVYEDAAAAQVLDAGGGRRAIRVTFQIPPDAPTTELSAHPCRYWEVDVEARADGGDYVARFLVPVY